MSNQSPSSDEGWSVVARELSEISGWEKLTYANGIIEERPIQSNQLELFDFAEDEYAIDPHYCDAVSDTSIEIKPELLQRVEPKPPPGNVNKYYPGRRDTAYYRFSYRDGKRVKHKHIRGGNTCSKEGQANAQMIREMIARKCSLGEILTTIASF